MEEHGDEIFTVAWDKCLKVRSSYPNVDPEKCLVPREEIKGKNVATKAGTSARAAFNDTIASDE